MKWGNLPLCGDIEYTGSFPSGSLLVANVYNFYHLINQWGDTTAEKVAFIKANARRLWKDTAEGSMPVDRELLSMPIVSDDGDYTFYIRLFCSSIQTAVNPQDTTCTLSFHALPAISLSETVYYGGYGDGGSGNTYYAIGARLVKNNVPVGIAFQIVQINAEGDNYSLLPAYDTALSLTYLSAKGFNAHFKDSDLDLPDDSNPDGYGQNDEGLPAHDHTSDTIGIPDPPSVSSHTTGFMHVYKISANALQDLGQYLFPDFFEDIWNLDLTGALRAVAGIFAYRDSIQYIVDMHAIPVEPTTSGNDYIRLGALDTEISQPVCSSDYVDFDCGSISLPLNEQNYLDYLCTAKLFLPFVGFVDINPEYWNGGTLSVKYRFNIIDGSFMAYVTSSSGVSKLSNSVIGQYGGSACLHLPVVADSYGSIASGLVGGSMAIAAGASSGNMLGAAASAATALNVQPKMSQSNNYNASTSYLGVRRPYLLIERPVPCMSGKYAHDKGLPVNVALRLSAVKGFTQISDIDLSGITGATDNELAELRQLLKDGVYF